MNQKTKQKSRGPTIWPHLATFGHIWPHLATFGLGLFQNKLPNIITLGSPSLITIFPLPQKKNWGSPASFAAARKDAGLIGTGASKKNHEKPGIGAAVIPYDDWFFI